MSSPSADAARAVADQHAAETLLRLRGLRRPEHPVEPATSVTVTLPDPAYGLLLEGDGTSIFHPLKASLVADIDARGCVVTVQGADGGFGLIILDGDDLRRLGLYALACADAFGAEVEA